ncbi:MAG: CBS domain-containing protein [Candidatus Micrarchaeota archaeon]|nr:CBS domain-containing protein [Candidatus Micrarchaeota archaeon]MDE1847677.1 CBS domain-containing protein [Candidatus Micrarchaeota archaeon]MDE1864498.1 CBS domain-containing protein [Candidatus Micrarchaeota archaeon]
MGMYSNTRSILVHDIMSHPVVTAQPDESIKSIAVKMQKHGVGSVVVVNASEQPLGIITKGDIVRRLVTKKRLMLRMMLVTKAKNAMTSPILTIDRKRRLEDAARFMMESKVKRLCVVSEEKKLIGIITDNDIMRHSSELIGVLNEIIDTGYVKEAGEIGIKM